MKTMIFVFILLGLTLGFASIAMAEEWYAAAERSSNDYRSSAGAVIAEVNGARYTPQYTVAEMKSAKIAVDTRQMAQSSVIVARTSASTNNSNANIRALPVTAFLSVKQ